MEILTPVLPIIKIVCTFVLMLAGIRSKLGLFLSIMLGGLFMSLIFGVSLNEYLRVSVKALIAENFLLLIAIVGAILVLSDGMERSGQSERLMQALSGYLHQARLRLVFFPALIGLLPMPGGAVFSAPMVKAISTDMQLSQEQRAVINYWFRHVWEMAWPLYPGLILTVSLADITIGELIIRSWPGVIAMFVVGWFFFLRAGVLKLSNTTNCMEKSKKNYREVVKEGAPLFLAIVGAVGLETCFARFVPSLPFEWGVIAALILAIACNMMRNNLGGAFLFAVLKKKSLWSMLLVIAAIFIFKDVMGAAGIVATLAAGAGGGMALFAAASILPFLVGAISGITVAFVGATFPLIIGLLDSLGMAENLLAYLVLGLFCGFTGVMISPLHICFVLTCGYFDTELLGTWRRIVAPCLCFAACGGGLFLLLLQ